MGAPLFYYPNEWRSIIGPIKAVSGGDTKVGVNVNWEKICGCPSFLIYSTQYYTVSAAHKSMSPAPDAAAASYTGQKPGFVHTALGTVLRVMEFSQRARPNLIRFHVSQVQFFSNQHVLTPLVPACLLLFASTGPQEQLGQGPERD